MSQSNRSRVVNENQSCILNILCKQHKGFNVVHFNARSLHGLKLDHVKHVFENSLVDVICVTETWYNNDINCDFYKINGYDLFCNNRVNKRGGGVAIYVKSSLKAKIISKSDKSEVEFINVEIYDSISKMLVSCVYNPNKMFSIEPFFSDLSNHLIDYDFYIACGDFNINLLNLDQRCEGFLDNICSTGLSVVNSNVPTRFAPNSTPSLLDLFISSDIKRVLLFDQISFISDHDLIFCSLDVHFQKNECSKIITYRDFKSINMNLLVHDFQSANYSACWYEPTVDGKLSALMAILQDLYNKHVPIRSFVITNVSCPWFTASIQQSIRDRNKYHSAWKKNPTPHNWTVFTRARNRTNHIIKKAKQLYFGRNLSTSLPPRKLWNNIKQFGIHSRSESSCCLDPNDLNKHFISVGAVHSSQAELNSTYFCRTSFQFSSVTESDVYKSVMNIQSNAVGEDGMSIRFIKIVLPYIINSLTHVFNHCITTSTFPKLWKVANIIPIAKKASASSPNDYRPISILPVFSKSLESLMCRQIQEYISANGLLSPMQSGFRSFHSCTTAALKILDDLRLEYDEGHISYMCLLDFSKAFDSVDHKLLCMKLKNYFGFSETASTLINSYLSNRTQKVRVGQIFSTARYTKCGVPQGSVLGPLLFSLFINDIFSICKHAKIHGYADDIQLYISNRIGLIEDLCSKLNDDVEAIRNWSIANKLSLNPEKSCILPVKQGNLDVKFLPKVFLGPTALKFVEKTKYLGFVINKSLSCVDHVNSVISKIYLTLRNLRMTSSFTPTELKRKLVIQLIIPFISYAAEVYSQLDSHSLHKLQVAFNNVTRYVYGLNRYSSISSWRKMILGIDLVDYLRYRNLLFLHRLLIHKSPNYLYDKIDFGRSTRCPIIILPHFNYINSARLFFVNSIRLWNSLPIHIRRISNACSFKKSLLDLIKNQG